MPENQRNPRYIACFYEIHIVVYSTIAGNYTVFIYFQEGKVTNPIIILVLTAVRIFLSLSTVTVTHRRCAVLGLRYQFFSI